MLGREEPKSISWQRAPRVSCSGYRVCAHKGFDNHPYLVFDVGGCRGDPQTLQLQALCDQHCQTCWVALVHNVIHQVTGQLEVIDLEGEGVIGAVHWSGLQSFVL